jgi:hypothetical protein
MNFSNCFPVVVFVLGSVSRRLHTMKHCGAKCKLLLALSATAAFLTAFLVCTAFHRLRARPQLAELGLCAVR